MSVELIFRPNPIDMVDKSLIPSDGGLSFDTSPSTPQINRHNVTIESSDLLYVQINGVTQSELSDTTEQNIIDCVPSSHILTRDG